MVYFPYKIPKTNQISEVFHEKNQCFSVFDPAFDFSFLLRCDIRPFQSLIGIRFQHHRQPDTNRARANGGILRNNRHGTYGYYLLSAIFCELFSRAVSARRRRYAEQPLISEFSLLLFQSGLARLC